MDLVNLVSIGIIVVIGFQLLVEWIIRIVKL
jgi:hypothetical protein